MFAVRYTKIFAEAVLFAVYAVIHFKVNFQSLMSSFDLHSKLVTLRQIYHPE